MSDDLIRRLEQAGEGSALARDDYHEHVKFMVEARRKATRTKVNYDAARV